MNFIYWLDTFLEHCNKGCECGSKCYLVCQEAWRETEWLDGSDRYNGPILSYKKIKNEFLHGELSGKNIYSVA